MWILAVCLAIGCPALLLLRARLWTLQRRREQALPEAIEHQALGERAIAALVDRLCQGVPALPGPADADPAYPAAALLLRVRGAIGQARRDVRAEGRPGGELAGPLLEQIAPALRADLRIAPDGAVNAQRLRRTLMSYVRASLLPVLREGRRRAYHGWDGQRRATLRSRFR